MAFVEVAGKRVWYEIEGAPEGRPLVLIHGLTVDSTVWREAGYVEALADHRLVSIDMLGHGRSDKPKDVDAYGDDGWTVDAVLAVADEAGVGRFAVWGWSAGGWQAWVTAQRAPDRVAALITTGNHDPRSETTDEAWEEFDEWIRRPVAEQGMQAVVDRVDEWDRAPQPEWMKEIMLRFDPEIFLLNNTRQGWRRGIDDLATFTVPTLLINGEFEDEEGRVHEIAGMLPRGESRILPGVGHVGAFLRTDLSLPVVRDFLDRRFPWPEADR